MTYWRITQSTLHTAVYNLTDEDITTSDNNGEINGISSIVKTEYYVSMLFPWVLSGELVVYGMNAEYTSVIRLYIKLIKSMEQHAYNSLHFNVLYLNQ